MSHEKETKQTPAAETKAPETEAKAPEQETPKAEKPEEKHEGKHHHETAALQAKLDEAEKKNEELKNQLLRTAAEYDNYRKRSQREADQKFNDGVSHAVTQILGILDTLDMAANAACADENYKKGVTMTLDKAAKALEALHHQKLWQNNKHKQYYSALTDILRTYVAARWGFGAMEMTSDEIIETMRAEELPDKARMDLTAILRDADLVKFAKATPEAEQNEADYLKAYYFVEETKVAETEEETEGQEPVKN